MALGGGYRRSAKISRPSEVRLTDQSTKYYRVLLVILELEAKRTAQLSTRATVIE